MRILNQLKYVKLKKLSISLFILMIFIGFSYVPQYKNPQISCDYSENSTDLTFDELNKADYWNLINSSIFIDDTDPNYNWSKITAENDWCKGSGTFNDPYVVENLTIDAYFIGSCIEIRNSQKFFRIDNCTLYNSGTGSWDSGISLYNTSMGQILNCQFIHLDSHSILVRNSINITIRKNRVENSPLGIRLLDSNNSIIDENSVLSNSQQGIALIRSFENLVTNNRIRYNSDYYLFLVDSSNNSISGNFIGGIDLWPPPGLGVGIVMWNSHINVISENIFKYMTLAINLDGSCSNNLIYKIYFNTYSSIPCIDNGLNNNWDNGSMGNYWSSYYGHDYNHDGIGDTSYDFGTGIDRYPIWREEPSIIVFSPQNEETYIKPPKFNLEVVTGKDIDAIYYTLNFTEKKYVITNFNGTIDSKAWFLMPNGLIFIVFSINDTFGLQTGVAIFITKKPMPPRSFNPTPFIISGIIALVVVVPSGMFIKKKLAFRNIASIDKNIQFKIKKSVLTFGKKGGRLEIKDIAQETEENKRVIIPVVTKMIEDKEIDAEYFKSSNSVVYNRKTLSNEIDLLISEFEEWEEGKKE